MRSDSCPHWQVKPMRSNCLCLLDNTFRLQLVRLRLPGNCTRVQLTVWCCWKLLYKVRPKVCLKQSTHTELNIHSCSWCTGKVIMWHWQLSPLMRESLYHPENCVELRSTQTPPTGCLILLSYNNSDKMECTFIISPTLLFLCALSSVPEVQFFLCYFFSQHLFPMDPLPSDSSCALLSPSFFLARQHKFPAPLVLHMIMYSPKWIRWVSVEKKQSWTLSEEAALWLGWWSDGGWSSKSKSRVQPV